MQKTSIPWADRSWNPTSGCNGPNGKPCPYCYARPMVTRFHRTFKPTCHPEKLDEPVKFKKPSRIFVDSNGDLFDPAIPDEFIERVFGVAALCQQHTMIILTKQAQRMQDWFTAKLILETRADQVGRYAEHIGKIVWDPRGDDYWQYAYCPGVKREDVQNRRRWPGWPLPNVWLGVTMEHDGLHDRVWQLLQTPAAVRFVSIEPILGPVELDRWELICRTWRKGATIGKYLDWVIIGNDSRPGQPMPDPAWVQAIIDQCRAAEVPIFVKGRLVEQWPIQEWPKGVQR